MSDCDSKHLAKGLCESHYRKMKRSSVDCSVVPDDREDLERRLESNAYYEPNTGCILWGGSTDEWKYGRMNWKYHNRGVHALAWASVNGEPDEGLVVRHKCDTPPCMNLDHLELGTTAQNNQDTISRGRTWSKLSESDVREILERSTTKEPRWKIAVDFNISESVISNIASGKSWKRVPRDQYIK